LLINYDFFLIIRVFWFIIFLLIIFFSVLKFGFFYIQFYFYFYFYFYLIFIFLIVIIIFLVSWRNHVIYCFWDLLGLVSFFLVLYYNNFISLKGSLETLIRNRLGDFFLLVFLVLGFYFSLFFLNFLSLRVLFLFFSSLIKRAQFPFMGWLTRAIAAPTPVSSLVHRSTLVTAGFFLLFFFNWSFYFLSFLRFFLGLMSLILSSFFSFFEKDIKKLVAWRTLSQVGLCFVFSSLGRSFLGFLHIISHAFFKSSLFLLMGYYIFMSFSQQDFRLGFFFCAPSFFFCGGDNLCFFFNGFFFFWWYIN
jgi:NADH-ubiquinone oxidoreductase chain 5